MGESPSPWPVTSATESIGVMVTTIGSVFGYDFRRNRRMEKHDLAEDDLLPQLIEVTGARSGRVHTLAFGSHVLGRGRDADVQLVSKDVSRRHARVEVCPEGVVVHDLGSKNGVQARGTRVVEPTLLFHGETLSIGDLTLSISHPASQVSRALQSAGEGTVTVTRTYVEPGSRSPGLLLPLLGVVTFALLAVGFLVF